MNKRFEIKVYDKTWTFKKNINESQNWQKLLMSDISFSYQKNWWQWELNLLLNKSFNSTDIIRSDFIKIFLHDKNFPWWKLIYTWVIEEINRNYKPSQNTIEYVCRWLSSLLTRFYYYDTNYTFSKTDTASNIIKSIINYANTHYNWFNTSWVVDTVWNITVEFDFTNCFDALAKVLEQTEKYLFMWEDWTVYFNKTASQNYVTAKKDLQDLSIVEDWSEIINKVIVVYNAWVYIWLDNTSITNNQLFEKKYDKSDLDLAGATAFANQILANNQEKNKTQLILNNNFILENLKPWDNLKIRNIDYLINSEISKVSYNTNTSTVYLEDYDSIGKVLKNI